MNGGTLRHRVELQRNIPGDQDAYGDPEDEWTTYAYAWANIVPQTGGESEVGRAIAATTSHLINLRYTKSLRPSDRIKYGERVFSIASVLNVGERKKELQIAATEELHAETDP